MLSNVIEKLRKLADDLEGHSPEPIPQTMTMTEAIARLTLMCGDDTWKLSLEYTSYSQALWTVYDSGGTTNADKHFDGKDLAALIGRVQSAREKKQETLAVAEAEAAIAAIVPVAETAAAF